MNESVNRETRPSLVVTAVSGLIRVYQNAVSVVLPSTCRFSPSCSQYALEAVNRFGVMRGLWMGARRILRCHPFHPGGYDPVEHR